MSFHVFSYLCTGGFWGDEWSLKALAVGAQVDIIVIALSQVQLYSRDPCYAPPQKRATSENRKFPAFAIFPHKYGGQQYDLPAEAFLPATRFLVYDGSTHYYVAYRKSEVDGSAVPSVSSAEAAGLKLLHPRTIASVPPVSAASKGPRSPTTRAAAKKQALQRRKDVCPPAANPPAASAALSPVDMEEEAAQGLMQMAHPSAALPLRRSSRKKQKRAIASL